MFAGAGAAAGLHHVGVQGALHQEFDVALLVDLPRGRLEDPDELATDDLPLLLGSVTPASAVRNRSAASTTCSRMPVAAT
jgi:hypothetical protein